MKIFLKILFLLLNMVNIGLSALSGCGAIWYTLPEIQKTKIGTFVLQYLTPQSIFWITVVSASFLILFYLVDKIFDRYLSAKCRNFFTHFNTWLIALIAIGLSITTFILAKVEVTAFELTTTRKIEIGVCFVLLLFAFLFGNKISKIINRKIQAYETSKEMNVQGRGSIIITNLLKLMEIMFPEVIVLSLVSFCLSVNVAMYFIVVLIAFTLPIFGNIDCDLTTRREINKLREQDKESLIDDISNSMRG